MLLWQTRRPISFRSSLPLMVTRSLFHLMRCARPRACDSLPPLSP
nr:MAG TPA: hypothetical protein [Caudoviricetes sp.]